MIYIITMLKTITLAVFWLIFPPLFLILSFVWKIPRKVFRILLFFVAPLTLLVLFAVSAQVYAHYYYLVERGSRKEIETRTGLQFPDYQTIEKRRFLSGPSLSGDFTVQYVIRLDTAGIQEFYSDIEALIPDGADSLQVQASHWTLNGKDGYSFYDAGTDHPDQEFLSVTILKSRAQAVIEYGSW